MFILLTVVDEVVPDDCSCIMKEAMLVCRFMSRWRLIELEPEIEPAPGLGREPVVGREPEP